MRTKHALLVVLGVATLILASVATGRTGAETLKFNAVLTIAKEASRPVPAGASGRFTATLTGRTLKWTLTFSRLSGPATESHVHGGPGGPERFQPVIVPVCGSYAGYGVRCRSGMSGTATLTRAQIALLTAGKTYVNVHTAKNPKGEIRGAIKVPAPEPVTSTVAVSMFEMGFKLSKTVVPRGTVIFKVVNNGRLPHDFSFGKELGGSALLEAGESGTLTVKFTKAGKYIYICTVEGHAESGMLGALTVE